MWNSSAGVFRSYALLKCFRAEVTDDHHVQARWRSALCYGQYTN